MSDEKIIEYIDSFIKNGIKFSFFYEELEDRYIYTIKRNESILFSSNYNELSTAIWNLIKII